MEHQSKVRRLWGDTPVASKIILFTSLLILLIVFSITVSNFQREKADFDRELENQADLLLGALTKTLPDDVTNIQTEKMGRIAREIAGDSEITRLQIYAADGSLLTSSSYPEQTPYSAQVDPESEPFLALGPDETHREWREGELVAGRSIWSGTEKVGAVEIGLSTEQRDKKLWDLTLRSLGLALILLTLGIMLSILMARQITNPISELSNTAKKMAAGDLSARFRRRGQDEIGQLGRAFNEMAAAIEKRDADLRKLARGLEQAVGERTQELQQKNQYLAALHEVTLGLIENLDVDRLLEAIMVRAASLANTKHAFVDVVDPERAEMQLRVAKGRYRRRLGHWANVNQGLSGRVIATGQTVIEKDYQQFADRHPDFTWLHTAIYMPLRSESAILGVIGLGYNKVVSVDPNLVEILDQFAQLASLALKNAQLYSAAQQELSDTEQALFVEEERRRAYETSPQGRAETMMAERILNDPTRALVTLHELTQRADQDANAAILPELPGVLDLAGQALLARLAEGYHFIYRSQSEPELLVVGLRQLRTGLELPEARSLRDADEALALFGLCQKAIDAGSVHAITELLPSLQVFGSNHEAHSIFAGLSGALKALLPAVESLYAYERVDTTEDRQAYLGSTVERLSQVDRLVHALHAAERPMAQRIIENWMAIVTGSMRDLQTRAKIVCRLLTRHSWEGEAVTVALQLRNEGHGMALNLRVTLAESPDYILVDDLVLVERLAPAEETQIELRVRPQLFPKSDQFRARFVILYDDPRGPNHAEHFADVVHLLAPEAAFQFIPNPYVAGTPLETGSPLFFGREDLFSFIGENLGAAHRNNLVLIGQRRTGKSSLLKQLPLRLGGSYVPVYLDGQSIALDPGLPAFFLNLATEIGFALQESGFSIANPVPHEFAEHPAHTFQRNYLRQVRAAIGNRHLVLLLDEFEELESAAKRGNLDPSIFGFLRHLIQHEPRLSVIFCGTHRMEELAADYWSVLFNISLYKHVGFLEHDEAIRLIEEPVAAYGMRYDDLALDKIWRITAGHPYFLQLLCHSVVSRHNRSGRSYVTVSDVNVALEDILSAGEAHFVYLWNESSLVERQVLTALSRMMTLTGRVTPVQVEDHLVARGIALDRHVIAETLHHLTLRDILSMQVDGQSMGVAGIYSWRLGLLGLWIEKYKSLSLIQEEARP